MTPDLSAFGPAALLRPLEGGARGPVWLVKTPAGLCVAKRTTRSEAALRWLDGVQAAARRAGFVVPEMVPATAGIFAGGGWTLDRFLPGIPATDADLQGLGARLGRFHAGGSTLPQRPGFLSCRELLVQDRGGDVDLGAMPAPLVSVCRDAWAALPDGAETAVHGDLHAGNVLLTPEGPALIDWDEARRDRPLFDRLAVEAGRAAEQQAALAWELSTCWSAEPLRARRLAQRLIRAAR